MNQASPKVLARSTGKNVYNLVMLDKRDQPKFTEEADWKTEFKLD